MNNKKIFSLIVLSLFISSNTYAMMDNEMKANVEKGSSVMKVMGGVEKMEENGEKMMEKSEEQTKKMLKNTEKNLDKMGENMGEKQERVMNKMEESSDDMMKKTMKGMEKMEENGEKMMEKSEEKMKRVMQKAEKMKEKVGKKAKKAESAMMNFEKRFENKSVQEQLNKFKELNTKIDKVMNKYLSLDISEEKKESYKNLFEYIKTLNNEKIAELEAKITK